MSNCNLNMLNQEIDIAASENRRDDLNISEESSGLGFALSSGVGATFSSQAGSFITVSGLSGFTTNSVGKFISFTGASNPNNNDTFGIIQFLSINSVVISAPTASFPESNNLNWTLRLPNSLEQDLNYIRSDRALIKGVPSTSAIPTFTRPDNLSLNIPANLLNLSGKGLDARGFINNEIYYNITPIQGNNFFILSDVGNLKHSDSNNKLGIPCFDTAPFINDYKSCYVEIANISGESIYVLNGINQNQKIFGIVVSGSSTSPNSIQINLFSYPPGQNFTTTLNSYIWEIDQENINIIIPKFKRTDQALDSDFRNYPNIQTAPNSSEGLTPNQHQTLRQLIHFIDNGPATGFTSGAFREILPSGSPFPTSIIWWEDSSKINKIVEKLISYNSKRFPITITWNMYDDGYSIGQVIDSVTYDGYSPFESFRTRSIL